MSVFLALATPLLVQSALAIPARPGPNASHGGIHVEQMADFGRTVGPATTPIPAALPPVTPGPDVTVYGYQAYWDDDLNAVPWDDLTHIAIFAAEAETDGSLTATSRWSEAATAVAMAAPYDVKVHLCVINFSPSQIAAIISNPTTRATLIANLKSWQQSTGAHGINIDFEGLPVANKADMVAFTTELDAAVPEVVLATPAVDWSGAWDYDALTAHADLFIMGYGYHWSGSSQPGPNDPLFGGGLWSDKSLAWTIDDYTFYGADPSRVILGLPLYGIEWPRSCGAGDVEDNLPCSATGTGSSVFYASAKDKAATYGRHLEAGSRTPWYDTGSRQGWYSDATSVAERAQHAKDEGIAGIGFWALHYDDGDPELWTKLRKVTHEPQDIPDEGTDPVDEPDNVVLPFSASAGQPVLAYVGDTVVLNGTGSTGPDAEDLSYTWTQTTGPRARLQKASSAQPRFVVETVGTYGFELVVGNAGTESAPDEAWVIAIDPDAGQRHSSCACATTTPALGWLLLPAALAGLRRRR